MATDSAPASQAKPQPATRRLGWGWVLLLVLTCLIGAIGAVAYRSLRNDLRDETQRTLAVIAEQKRQQIEAVLGTARHDAELYFTGHPPITALIVEWLAGGQTDEPLLARIRKRMGEIATLQGWAGLAVLDTAGRPAFTLGEAGTSTLGDLIQETLRQPRIRAVDLHLNAHGEPEYGVLAPIGLPGAPPVGLAYLSWRADQTLFRLVDSWPVPTESAETFLIRREGDLVRFLTPLRYRPAAALTYTQPADAPDQSASVAARGQRGILGQARDYRGVPVLAYATPITGSPWLMIAKIDEREADAGIRKTAWVTVLVAGLSLLSIYFAGVVLWRRDRQQRDLAALQVRQTAEARFRVIFEQAPLGVALIDSLSGRLIEVNQRFADIAGRTREEMASIDWMQITHPDDVQDDLDNMARLNAGEISGFHMNKRYLRPDGASVWISMTIAPMTAAVGDGPCHLCMIEDISERLRQEEALAQAQVRAARYASEQRLLAVIDQGLAGVVEFDLEGRLIRVNDRCCALLGHTREALIGRCWQGLTVAEDRDSDTPSVVDPFRRGQPCVIEQRLLCQGGESRWVTVSTSPISDQAGQPLGAVALILDITARKQAEADLAQQRDRLQQANRALAAEIDERRRVEAQLRDSEDAARQRWNELEAVYATAPVGLCVLDTELRFRRVNGHLAEINGRPVAAHLGRTVREIVPDLAATAEPLFRRIIASGEPLLNHPVVEGVGPVAETFPAIPGIDRVRAAQTLGQDRAFFLRLLRGFADDFANAVAATRRDLARGEREAATRRLHTLRGNAGNLGAIDLMESARGLEESLVRGASASDLEEGLAVLDGQLDAFLAASAPWRSAPTQTLAEPEPAPETGDTAALPLDPLQLASLREALSRNDAKARRLFHDLEPSLRAALGTEIVQAVGLAIGNLRFDTALAVLDQAALDQAGAGLPMRQCSGDAGASAQTP